ncbi:MAG TPA: DUF938 domain-containing protein [Myxococcota bacterium]
MNDARLRYPATARNREPIVAVLRRLLPASAAAAAAASSSSTTLLEVASGSGEHAVFFAEQLPHLVVQPSDHEQKHRDSVVAWTAAHGLGERVRPPVALDTTQPWPLLHVDHVDAVFCANMIHIAPWAAALGLFAGAAALLAPGAPLILYGPFLRRDVVTVESNVAFDASLKGRDPTWGIRHLDDEVVPAAITAGFVLDEVVEMPANNLIVVFRRGESA